MNNHPLTKIDEALSDPFIKESTAKGFAFATLGAAFLAFFLGSKDEDKQLNEEEKEVLHAFIPTIQNPKSETWYHGRNVKDRAFDLSKTGEGHAQNGVGFYFTSDYENAKSYAYPSGITITASIKPRKLLSLTKKPLPHHVDFMLENAPNLDDTLTNFAEDKDLALRAAKKAIFDQGNEKEAYEQLWYDFYRYQPEAYLRNMVKLGYDGVIVPQQEGVRHFIVFNPDIIKIQKVEDFTKENPYTYTKRVLELEKAYDALGIVTMMPEEFLFLTTTDEDQFDELRKHNKENGLDFAAYEEGYINEERIPLQLYFHRDGQVVLHDGRHRAIAHMDALPGEPIQVSIQLDKELHTEAFDKLIKENKRQKIFDKIIPDFWKAQFNPCELDAREIKKTFVSFDSTTKENPYKPEKFKELFTKLLKFTDTEKGINLNEERHYAIDSLIKEAISFFKKNDRIMYILKLARIAFANEISNGAWGSISDKGNSFLLTLMEKYWLDFGIKLSELAGTPRFGFYTHYGFSRFNEDRDHLKHFVDTMEMLRSDSMERLVWEKQTPTYLMAELKALEDKTRAKKRVASAQNEIEIIKFDDGFRWVVIPVMKCEREAFMLKHCGTVSFNNSVLLSLRSTGKKGADLFLDTVGEMLPSYNRPESIEEREWVKLALQGNNKTYENFDFEKSELSHMTVELQIINRELNLEHGEDETDSFFDIDPDKDTGFIQQSHIYGNQKPPKDYYPYFMELLKHPIVSSLMNKGYNPKSSILISDLRAAMPEEYAALEKEKPGISSPRLAYKEHKSGVIQRVKETWERAKVDWDKNEIIIAETDTFSEMKSIVPYDSMMPDEPSLDFIDQPIDRADKIYALEYIEPKFPEVVDFIKSLMTKTNKEVWPDNDINYADIVDFVEDTELPLSEKELEAVSNFKDSLWRAASDAYQYGTEAAAWEAFKKQFPIKYRGGDVEIVMLESPIKYIYKTSVDDFIESILNDEDYEQNVGDPDSSSELSYDIEFSEEGCIEGFKSDLDLKLYGLSKKKNPKKSKKICMSKKMFVKEHKHLLKVLKKGGKRARMKEYKDQLRELEEVVKGNPTWWDKPSTNRFAKGMTEGEVIMDWLSRHKVEKNSLGQYKFYHATPKTSKFDVIRAGSLLETDPKDASHFAGRDRNLKPEQIKTFVLWLYPTQIITGVWASLREDYKVGEAI